MLVVNLLLLLGVAAAGAAAEPPTTPALPEVEGRAAASDTENNTLDGGEGSRFPIGSVGYFLQKRAERKAREQARHRQQVDLEEIMRRIREVALGQTEEYTAESSIESPAEFPTEQ